MNPWDLVPYTVTPAAQVLARCIASGVLSQEHLEAVPRESNVFSQQLLVSEQVIAVERENDKKNLEVDLLKLEKRCADVTHSFYLSQKFTALQESARHLQEILREQTSLRQRLMKPLCQENLPIEANLQRYVVELMDMVVDFVENLERKMKATHSIPIISQSMTNLSHSLTQLLTQVADVEELSRQVLQWKDYQHNIISNNNKFD
ncbi:HAUS augmin-like complex subunit 2 [Scleropages formosus]|uniref:HAUS augmin like complex subunit 2 n=1 Tax=Scleropages formosus TaxID=113540 RepID=A0A8C9VHP0_SCLFO|nr:HAUS augmin-like complex subunit 2 [Scleropages formosus]